MSSDRNSKPVPPSPPPSFRRGVYQPVAPKNVKPQPPQGGSGMVPAPRSTAPASGKSND